MRILTRENISVQSGTDIIFKVKKKRNLTAFCHSLAGGHVTVFTVHVDGSTTGHVTQPDGEILDLCGAFVIDL